MTNINAGSLITRSKNHLDTELDDEVIMMHIDSGEIYAMADTAKQIWGQLCEPVVFERLIDHLVERFDVDRDTCIAEVSRFLFDLEKQAIIEINNAPATA